MLSGINKDPNKIAKQTLDFIIQTELQDEEVPPTQSESTQESTPDSPLQSQVQQQLFQEHSPSWKLQNAYENAEPLREQSPSTAERLREILEPGLREQEARQYEQTIPGISDRHRSLDQSRQREPESNYRMFGDIASPYRQESFARTPTQDRHQPQQTFAGTPIRQRQHSSPPTITSPEQSQQ